MSLYTRVNISSPSSPLGLHQASLENLVSKKLMECSTAPKMFIRKGELILDLELKLTESFPHYSFSFLSFPGSIFAALSGLLGSVTPINEGPGLLTSMPSSGQHYCPWLLIIKLGQGTTKRCPSGSPSVEHFLPYPHCIRAPLPSSNDQGQLSLKDNNYVSFPLIRWHLNMKMPEQKS